MPPGKNATELKPAPGDLRLFQAFLNTVDREAGTDELSSPFALAGWLERQGLLVPAVQLGPADLERARAVRSGWHALLGGSQDRETLDALDGALATATLRVRHGAGGIVRLEPTIGGLDGAFGRLLAGLVAAQDDGTWRRLKVCASAACRAVFWDHSTNGSARWCRPRCGNLISARASRRRRGTAKKSRHRKPRVEASELSPEPTHPDLQKYYDLLREREVMEQRDGPSKAP